MSTQKGQFTQVELEMMVDQYAKAVPATCLMNAQNAIILWNKFNELKNVGFTEKQAMQIIVTRPIIEG